MKYLLSNCHLARKGPVTVCRVTFVLVVVLLASATAYEAALAEETETGGRQRQRSIKVQRQEVFEFTEPLKVRKVGRDDYEISFASKDYCDVAVAIEDRKGRIIKHLAAGLLGPEAPEPLLKNSLTQTLRWDGKDDYGQYPRDLSGWRVRVSLGLKVAFEHVCDDYHPKNNTGNIPAVGADEDGVYVLSIGWGCSTVRMFDHQGNYLRTVYPFPRDKIEEFPDLPYEDYPDGAHVPRKDYGSWADFVGFDNPEGAPPPKVTMVVHDGRIVLTAATNNGLVYFGTDGGAAGELPLYGPEPFHRGKIGRYESTLRSFYPVVPRRLAASPDGKWLYITCVYIKPVGGPLPPHFLHGFWRIPFAATSDLESAKTCFIGEGMTPGTDPDQLNTPKGIATDSQGRIYVCDHLGDRISVFTPEGKPIKTIPVQRPDWINVHPQTGEIYLLSCPKRVREHTGYGYGSGEVFELVKLGSLENPKILARQRFTIPTNGFEPLMTMDLWAERPTAWVVVGPGSLSLYEDRGDEFVFKANFRQELKEDWRHVPVLFPSGRRAPQMSEGAPARVRVFHDPARNDLYCGWGSSFSQLRRYNPETGKLDAFVMLPFDAEDAAFDGRGYLYLRETRQSGVRQSIARFDPVSMEEVPFDYGEELFIPWWNRPTRGAIETPMMSFGRFHDCGLAVSKTGEVYVFGKNTQIGFKSNMHGNVLHEGGTILKGTGGLFGWTYSPGDNRYLPQRYPGRFLNIANLVFVYRAVRQLKLADAIQGITHASRGIGTDMKGNIFICTSDTGIVYGQPYGHPFSGNRGVLFKFPPTGGRFLGEKTQVSLKELPDRPHDLISSYFSGGNQRVWVEGVEWYFPGIGTVSHMGCRCMKNRFAVDYFGRIFVPEPDRYSVSVLDNSGMVILRFGHYGNADSAGSDSAVPIGGDEIAFAHTPHLAVDTDNRLFAMDMWNKRIVSIKLSYHAEQRAPLPGQ